MESRTRLTSKRYFVLDSTTFLNFRVPDSTKSSKIACLCTVMTTLRRKLTEKHVTLSDGKIKQAWTGPSRRHIQGSKIAKDFQVSIYSTRKSKNQKSGPSGAPGPANASPWRAKRGDTSEIVNIFVAVEGGTLWRKNKLSKKKSHNAEKQKRGPSGFLNTQSVENIKEIEGGTFGEKIFRKKCSQCRKTERGDPLGFFIIHSVAKHQKIEAGIFFNFGKKSHNAKKTERGTLFWDFSTSILSQNSNKMEGGTLWGKNFRRKVSQCRKKMKGGGLFGLAPYGMLRGTTGKTFLVQFARPNGAIWCNNIP